MIPHVWEFDEAAVTVTVPDETPQLPAMGTAPCTDVAQIGLPVYAVGIVTVQFVALFIVHVPAH